MRLYLNLEIRDINVENEILFFEKKILTADTYILTLTKKRIVILKIIDYIGNHSISIIKFSFRQ